ncbi:casein kinase substrate phosphoprotein PP28-domain-containing protein [Fusarium tricinctum]|uniref:Casein kinase substrate phosphoprotein PP28-domain-containing protein n=2 Tax=Fusarium tricinctum species complex TaxID=679429 RepID=A0A8K0WC12_9HYPO|nr:casein kinase substrate phosphoprotein PP28-domain-containing protein [Fusarium tricinctum]
MAPGGPPGTGARGRGGKFRKPTRGGGKKFSRDIRPLDADGNEVSMWAAGEKPEGDSDDDESSEEETSEEEDDEPEAGPAEPETQEESREARKAEKKARKEAAIAKLRAKTVEVGDMPSSDESESESDDDDMPANPNHSKEARKQAAVGMEEITEGVEGLKAAPTRREREALEAAAAKEKHMRLTAQGKTDQSKADLERLKAIREQRALDAARREAEREEKDEQEKTKKAEIEAREARRREAAAGKKGKKK